MNYSLPLSMGFSRQEYWRGLPFPSPGNLSNPGMEAMSPALQENSLPTELSGKPTYTQTHTDTHTYTHLYVHIHTHIYIRMYIHIPLYIHIHWASLVAQWVMNLPAMQETWVRSQGWEPPPEKEMATRFRSVAWKIPWTEEPGRL